MISLLIVLDDVSGGLEAQPIPCTVDAALCATDEARAALVAGLMAFVYVTQNTLPAGSQGGAVLETTGESVP